MTDQSSPGGRRKSFVEMLAPRSTNASSLSTSPTAAGAPPQPIPSHRRGMSITALGLAGSAGQSSPLDAFAKQRRASIAASSPTGSPEFRNSFDDGAVIEEDDFGKSPVNSPPSPSFGRRLSFGAQALRDVKQPGGSLGTGGGEGFNWSEAMRDKTKRAPSISGNPFAMGRARSASTTSPEPPKEMPKASPPSQTPLAKMKKPDHLGERMLRGDFMMD